MTDGQSLLQPLDRERGTAETDIQGHPESASYNFPHHLNALSPVQNLEGGWLWPTALEVKTLYSDESSMEIPLSGGRMRLLRDTIAGSIEAQSRM